MKIKIVGPNQTELHLTNGTVIFFSYETPVAARLRDGDYVGVNEKYSPTTSKHVNKWLHGRDATQVTPGFFASLLGDNES